MTKFLIYAFKLFDALKTMIIKQPVYQLERIGSTIFSMQRDSKKPGRLCGWGNLLPSTTVSSSSSRKKPKISLKGL